MLYYYANSGHKLGLERVRRGVALLKKLNEKGIETQLLVNDFRAGLAAKDMGVPSYITVETVQDIDAIAQPSESIIIDSIEDDHGRLVKYCADFKQVWRFEHSSEDASVHGELLFRENCSNGDCEKSLSIDSEYFLENEKEDRVLFFLGDADYDKIILNNEEFFKSFSMELLLGTYFFVKHEDDLAKIFTTLHEPEDYTELIKNSSTIVTTSSQTAIEAKISNAKVIYLDIGQVSIYSNEIMKNANIEIINGFNIDALSDSLKNDNFKKLNTRLKFADVDSIIKKL